MEPLYLASVNNMLCPWHCFNLILCFFPRFAWYQSLSLISEQFVCVFSCHFACCTPAEVLGCGRSCISCLVGQQQESAECFFLPVCLWCMGLKRQKGRCRTNRGFVFIHSFNRGEKAGHFYLRQCSLAVLPLCRCCCSNWSYHFRVWWTVFSELNTSGQQESWYISYCTSLQKLWNIGLLYAVVIYEYVTVTVWLQFTALH